MNLYHLSAGGAAMLAAFVHETSPKAQPQACGPRDIVVRSLERDFQEQQTNIGISGGAVVELFKSDGGKTWTLVITLPNGQSCLVGSGNDWQAVTAKVGEPS